MAGPVSATHPSCSFGLGIFQGLEVVPLIEGKSVYCIDQTSSFANVLSWRDLFNIGMFDIPITKRFSSCGCPANIFAMSCYFIAVVFVPTTG